jgi:hypothetical protein
MLRERTRTTHHVPANLCRNDPVSDQGQPWRLGLRGSGIGLPGGIRRGIGTGIGARIGTEIGARIATGYLRG